MQAKSTHFIINEANITSEIIELKTMEKYKIIQSSFGTLCSLWLKQKFLMLFTERSHKYSKD